MKFRLPRPSQMPSAIRELARRRPLEAEEYLDSHHEAWEQIAGAHPHEAADILEALDEEGAADLLGVKPSTLAHQMKMLGIVKPIKSG